MVDRKIRKMPAPILFSLKSTPEMNGWKMQYRSIRDRQLRLPPRILTTLSILGNSIFANGSRDKAIETWDKMVKGFQHGNR